MYYRLIPFKRTFDTFGLVYKVPEDLLWVIFPGNVVVVELRWEPEIALVCNEISREDINCNVADVKEIISLTSEKKYLSSIQISIIDFVSQYYISPIHHALGLYFPKNLVEKISKNTVDKIKNKSYSYSENINISMTQNQEDIFQKIYNNQDQKKHLIYWVTGSGKTQIYMKIISENLKQGKQSLLLIPEIILTSQIWDKIKRIFWDDVIMLHSGVSAAKKSWYWMDIYSWNAKVIIGTRSALFYPYNNLASIIIDEEHDQSYISDSAPRYHSLDVAEEISKQTWCSLILGSWTPKVSTFYRWLRGDLQVLQLLEKYK